MLDYILAHAFSESWSIIVFLNNLISTPRRSAWKVFTMKYLLSVIVLLFSATLLVSPSSANSAEELSEVEKSKQAISSEDCE